MLVVFHIMAAMVEMERDPVRERTTAALIVARREGRAGGRKPMAKWQLGRPKVFSSDRIFCSAGVLSTNHRRSAGECRKTRSQIGMYEKQVRPSENGSARVRRQLNALVDMRSAVFRSGRRHQTPESAYRLLQTAM